MKTAIFLAAMFTASAPPMGDDPITQPSGIKVPPPGTLWCYEDDRYCITRLEDAIAEMRALHDAVGEAQQAKRDLQKERMSCAPRKG